MTSLADRAATTGAPFASVDQQVVDYICRMLSGADLLDVETTNAFGHTTRWLLVPVGYAELEFLAAFGDDERENDHDAEDDPADREDDGSYEPNIVEPETVQSWGERGLGADLSVSRWRRIYPARLPVCRAESEHAR